MATDFRLFAIRLADKPSVADGGNDGEAS